MRHLSVLILAALLLLNGCNLFPEDCDHAPEVFDGGTLFSDRGECNFLASPGYGVRLDLNFNYGAVGGQQTNFRWKFSTNDFYLVDTNEQIIGEYEGKEAAIVVYAKRRLDVDQVVTQIEAIAYNECGQSNPYRGTLTIVHGVTPTYGSVDFDYPAVPSSVRHHGQAYYKGELYVLFGKRKDNGRVNYKYNFTSNQWTELQAPAQASNYLYTDQYRQVHLDNKVYFFHNHGYYNEKGEHYVYNLDNHTLTPLPPLPGEKEYLQTQIHHGIWPVAYNNDIIVGPYYHSQNQYAIAKLNPTSNTWSVEHFLDPTIFPGTLVIYGAPYPTTRNFGEMAAVFGDVLLYRFEKSIGWYEYNFSSKTGQRINSIEFIRAGSGVGAFMWKGKAYLLAGSDYGVGDFKNLYQVTNPLSGAGGLKEHLMLQGTNCYSKSWSPFTYGARVTEVEGFPYYIVENGMIRLSLE